MWLDRLSGHSIPNNPPSQPHGRSYSPNPRRPNHLAPPTVSPRPAFSPRSSSLSLVSNDSTTSLLGSSKRPNGSGLKHSTNATDYPEPLQVLEKLFGPQVKSAGKNGVLAHSIDPELGELDFGGLSLREFGRTQEPETKDVQSYNPQTVEECVSNLWSLPASTNALQMKRTKPNSKTSIVPFAPATTCSIPSKLT